MERERARAHLSASHLMPTLEPTLNWVSEPSPIATMRPAPSWPPTSGHLGGIGQSPFLQASRRAVRDGLEVDEGRARTQEQATRRRMRRDEGAERRTRRGGPCLRAQGEKSQRCTC